MPSSARVASVASGAATPKSGSGDRARARYWEDFARQAQRQPPPRLWRAYCDRVHERLLAHWLPRTPVARALKTDLYEEAHGPGIARTIAASARCVVAVDLAWTAARAASDRHGTVSSWAVADAVAFPFVDSVFDLVVSTSTLDHLPDLATVGGALADLHRVLRPGGELILTFDNGANPLIAARQALPRSLRARVGGRLASFVGVTCSPAQLARLVTEAGFAIRDSRGLMHAPRVLALPLLARLDRAGIDAAGIVRRLVEWEGLDAVPVMRWRTAHFVAIRAVRPVRDEPISVPRMDRQCVNNLT